MAESSQKPLIVGVLTVRLSVRASVYLSEHCDVARWELEVA